MSVLLVRHAVALPRRSWAGTDADRPLDDRGHKQARSLVTLLAASEVVRVLASRAIRCVATVEPLAEARGLEVEAEDDLFEGNGHGALALVRSLLAAGSAGADGPAVVLCSHGDVIPEILEALAQEGADLGPDQRCKKGSTWVLHCDAGSVSARYLPPPA